MCGGISLSLKISQLAKLKKKKKTIEDLIKKSSFFFFLLIPHSITKCHIFTYVTDSTTNNDRRKSKALTAIKIEGSMGV